MWKNVMNDRIKSRLTVGALACIQVLALTACGGGQSQDSAATVPIPAQDLPNSRSPINNNVFSSDMARGGLAIDALTIGSNRNMVSSSKDCGICVFNAISGDQNEKIKQATLAVDAGKTVVIDSDGSDEGMLAVAKLTGEIAGIRISAPVVKITRSPDGDQVTPISVSLDESANTTGKTSTSNSLNDVLNLDEGATHQ